ncbi:RNA binding protein [Striga asiatica]|uniref:RNA binding protein n=1 Tax=Striga asiatica TaxID=4170 RepID=A0A5A7PU32_STRAF|nr:RNA binding protein [Striga asiatica]
MERKFLENPYSPTSQPPENILSPTRRFLYPIEFQPQSHLISSFADQIQDIDSAFSKLALSPEPRFHAQTPSFLGLSYFHDDDTNGFLPFREPLKSSFWADSQSINDGLSGRFGDHQKINVGPDAMGFTGKRGPYTQAGDPRLLKSLHCQDFYDTGCDYYDYSCLPSSLHGKEQFFSRKATSFYPISPFVQQSNPVSPRPSQHSNKWQQQVTPEILRSKIVSLAKDQMWCGALSLKVEEGLSEREIEMVLPQVIEYLCDLMRNQFGSHFVYKFFVSCNEDQRTNIIIALTRSPFKLISICLNSYGARSVQKILEKLITPQQISLVVSALSPGAITLVNDPSGHHVIQYCVRNFPGEYNKHLFNEIADNCFKIATNKSGCCVLPPCVEYSHGEARERLVRAIIANAVHLAEDPYGNYVVQHLLGLDMQEVTADLVRRLQGSFVSLSCNKYASNVVEKLLLESQENNSDAIIMELLTSPNASMLLLDPFGNFVIQSALSASKGHIHDALLNLIQANAPSMQSNLYGKKILAWFAKRKLHTV